MWYRAGHIRKMMMLFDILDLHLGNLTLVSKASSSLAASTNHREEFFEM